MKDMSMTLQALEKALELPEGWKRSNAFREFEKTDYGIEALPLLEKAMDDKFISVILVAIECVGKLGPQALVGESSDRNTPRGLVAKLFLLGNRVWDYSGYKNCYSTCLKTLVKLGYTSRFLFEYIRGNLDLEGEDDFIYSLAALKAIGTPEALELLKRSAEARLPDLNKTYTKKVHAILAKAGLTAEQPKTAVKDWYLFHTLEIKAGKLWAGDPQLPTADDGFTVNVPAGNYIVECDGLPGRCKAVSKLRVRLESVEGVKRGKKLGETGTDSATIGVCEIAAFEAADKKKGGSAAIQKAIDSQKKDFGVVTVPKFPGLVMPFVPTGSDGSGPVFALVSGKRCVGIELVFMSE
jgi:hypothetical protein